MMSEKTLQTHTSAGWFGVSAISFVQKVAALEVKREVGGELVEDGHESFDHESLCKSLYMMAFGDEGCERAPMWSREPYPWEDVISIPDHSDRTLGRALFRFDAKPPNPAHEANGLLLPDSSVCFVSGRHFRRVRLRKAVKV